MRTVGILKPMLYKKILRKEPKRKKGRRYDDGLSTKPLKGKKLLE